jgi:FkbM family methyltransferase
MNESNVKNFIQLDTLVSQECLVGADLADSVQLNPLSIEVRGVTLLMSVASRRTLWQSVGLEHIEPELLDFIDNIPENATFFDVGASIGAFSSYAAGRGLQVFAFEPESANFALLNKNIYLNNRFSRSINAFNVALSNVTQLSTIFVQKYEAGRHNKILGKPINVGEKDTFEAEFSQTCICETMDSFIARYNLPIPHSLKIDVDGSELAVIEGAMKSLSDERLQKIFIELDDNYKEKNLVIKLLKSSGFNAINKFQVQNYKGLYNYVFSK